jgi:hypothetical protein
MLAVKDKAFTVWPMCGIVYLWLNPVFMRIHVLVCAVVLASCGGNEKRAGSVNKPAVTQPQQQVQDVTPFNYLENARLKGPVRSMRYITYDVVHGDEDQRLVSAVNEGNFFVTLDEKGWMLASVFYDPDGNVKKTDSAFFNAYGQYVGFRSYNGENQHENTTNMKYDIKGRLVEMSLIDTAGKVGMIGTFTNDLYGYPQKSEMKRASGRIISTAGYTHDAGGLMLSATYYDGNGKIKSTETMTYDENGNLIESKSEYTDPPSTQIKKYSYVFDEQGNWTKKTISNSDGIILQVVERALAYFENV